MAFRHLALGFCFTLVALAFVPVADAAAVLAWSDAMCSPGAPGSPPYIYWASVSYLAQAGWSSTDVGATAYVEGGGTPAPSRSDASGWWASPSGGLIEVSYHPSAKVPVGPKFVVFAHAQAQVTGPFTSAQSVQNDEEQCPGGAGVVFITLPPPGGPLDGLIPDDPPIPDDLPDPPIPENLLDSLTPDGLDPCGPSVQQTSHAPAEGNATTEADGGQALDAPEVASGIAITLVPKPDPCGILGAAQ